MSRLAKILKNVQNTRASHQSALHNLKKEFDKVPLENFFASVSKVLNVTFNTSSIPHGNQYVERTLDFLAKFVADSVPRDANEEDLLLEICTHPFLTMIIKETLKYHNVVDDNLRYNSCQFVRLILQHIGANRNLDNDICDLIEEAMLERAVDPKPVVRLQAVLALIRLQDPSNPESPINQAYLTLIVDSNAQIRTEVVKNIAAYKNSVPEIIKRLRDVDINVRMAAVRRIADFGPSSFKIIERQHILSCCVAESNPKVKNVFIENLLPKWLNACEKNYISFFNGLKLDADESDITNTERITRDILNIFLDFHPVREIFSNVPLDEKKVIPLDKLTSEAVAIWNNLVFHLRQNENLDDYLDEIIPELTPFCNYIESYVKEKAKKEMEYWEFLDYQYILTNLLGIAEGYDLADEVGRKTLHQLTQKLLREERLLLRPKEKIVALIAKTAQKTDDFTNIVCLIISEIHEPLIEKEVEEHQTEDVNTQCQKAELKVKIIRLEAYLEDATDNQDYLKANELKEEIIQLRNKLQEMVTEKPVIEMVKTRKDDPTTICDCLDILISLLVLPTVSAMTPSLMSIKDSFVLPLLNTNNNDINWRVLKCMALFCVLDESIAEEYLKVLCIPIITYRANYSNDALIVSIKAVSDMFRLYGTSVFGTMENAICNNSSSTSTNPNHSNTRRLYTNDEFDESLSITNKFHLNSIIEIILDMLNDEVSEIRNIAIEAISKLILNGFPVTPLLITRLILKWYNPLTAQTSDKSQQLIGVLISNYARCTEGATEVISKAVIPTLQSIVSAPRNSPIAEIDVENVLLFFSTITNSDEKMDISSTHINMAHTFTYEIIKKKNRLIAGYLSKLLTHLNVSTSNSTVLKELIAQVDIALTDENLSEKVLRRNLLKFKEKLNVLLENNNRTMDTNLELTENTINTENKENETNNSNLENVQQHQHSKNNYTTTLTSIIEEDEENNMFETNRSKQSLEDSGVNNEQTDGGNVRTSATNINSNDAEKVDDSVSDAEAANRVAISSTEIDSTSPQSAPNKNTDSDRKRNRKGDTENDESEGSTNSKRLKIQLQSLNLNQVASDANATTSDSNFISPSTEEDRDNSENKKRKRKGRSKTNSLNEETSSETDNEHTKRRKDLDDSSEENEGNLDGDKENTSKNKKDASDKTSKPTVEKSPNNTQHSSQSKNESQNTNNSNTIDKNLKEKTSNKSIHKCNSSSSTVASSENDKPTRSKDKTKVVPNKNMQNEETIKASSKTNTQTNENNNQNRERLRNDSKNTANKFDNNKKRVDEDNIRKLRDKTNSSVSTDGKTSKSNDTGQEKRNRDANSDTKRMIDKDKIKKKNEESYKHRSRRLQKRKFKNNKPYKIRKRKSNRIVDTKMRTNISLTSTDEESSDSDTEWDDKSSTNSDSSYASTNKKISRNNSTPINVTNSDINNRARTFKDDTAKENTKKITQSPIEQAKVVKDLNNKVNKNTNTIFDTKMSKGTHRDNSLSSSDEESLNSKTSQQERPRRNVKVTKQTFNQVGKNLRTVISEAKKTADTNPESYTKRLRRSLGENKTQTTTSTNERISRNNSPNSTTGTNSETSKHLRTLKDSNSKEYTKKITQSPIKQDKVVKYLNNKVNKNTNTIIDPKMSKRTPRDNSLSSSDEESLNSKTSRPERPSRSVTVTKRTSNQVGKNLRTVIPEVKKTAANERSSSFSTTDTNPESYTKRLRRSLGDNNTQTTTSRNEGISRNNSSNSTSRTNSETSKQPRTLKDSNSKEYTKKITQSPVKQHKVVKYLNNKVNKNTNTIIDPKMSKRTPRDNSLSSSDEESLNSKTSRPERPSRSVTVTKHTSNQVGKNLRTVIPEVKKTAANERSSSFSTTDTNPESYTKRLRRSLGDNNTQTTTSRNEGISRNNSSNSTSRTNSETSKQPRTLKDANPKENTKKIIPSPIKQDKVVKDLNNKVNKNTNTIIDPKMSKRTHRGNSLSSSDEESLNSKTSRSERPSRNVTVTKHTSNQVGKNLRTIIPEVKKIAANERSSSFSTTDTNPESYTKRLRRSLGENNTQITTSISRNNSSNSTTGTAFSTADTNPESNTKRLRRSLGENNTQTTTSTNERISRNISSNSTTGTNSETSKHPRNLKDSNSKENMKKITQSPIEQHKVVNKNTNTIIDTKMSKQRHRDNSLPSSDEESSNSRTLRQERPSRNVKVIKHISNQAVKNLVTVIPTTDTNPESYTKRLRRSMSENKTQPPTSTNERISRNNSTSTTGTNSEATANEITKNITRSFSSNSEHAEVVKDLMNKVNKNKSRLIDTKMSRQSKRDDLISSSDDESSDSKTSRQSRASRYVKVAKHTSNENVKNLRTINSEIRKTTARERDSSFSTTDTESYTKNPRRNTEFRPLEKLRASRLLTRHSTSNSSQITSRSNDSRRSLRVLHKKGKGNLWAFRKKRH